jgi:hypothetical protein
MLLSSFLGSTAQNPAEFLEGFSTIFLKGMVVSPSSNLHPGEPGLCMYILQRQGSMVIYLQKMYILLR